MTPQALKMFTVPEIIVITRFIQTNKNNCNIASRLIFTKAGKQLLMFMTFKIVAAV